MVVQQTESESKRTRTRTADCREKKNFELMLLFCAHNFYSAASSFTGRHKTRNDIKHTRASLAITEHSRLLPSTLGKCTIQTK